MLHHFQGADDMFLGLVIALEIDGEWNGLESKAKLNGPGHGVAFSLKDLQRFPAGVM